MAAVRYTDTGDYLNPKVKGLFLGIDGIVRAENLPNNKREVEFLDGSHPYLPAAVYYDLDGIGPPIFICWHNRPMPEGVPEDRTLEESFIKEAFHLTQHKMKPLISKRWHRTAWWSLAVFFKMCIVGFLTAFTVLVLRVVIL